MAAIAIAIAVAALGAGCGGDGENHDVVVALGDSITAGNPGYDPDPAVRRRLGLGHNPESQWEYWAEREHPDLEIRNCGVRGESTGEIAQRFDQCTRDADGIVIQGGINDLAQGVPITAAAANLRAIVRSAQERDLDVAIADLLPLNVGGRAEDAAIADLNRRIVKIAEDEEVPILPFHRVLEDPQNPGRMRPKWTADGEHPSVAGYRQLGERAFRPPDEMGGMP